MLSVILKEPNKIHFQSRYLPPINYISNIILEIFFFFFNIQFDTVFFQYWTLILGFLSVIISQPELAKETT